MLPLMPAISADWQQFNTGHVDLDLPALLYHSTADRSPLHCCQPTCTDYAAVLCLMCAMLVFVLLLLAGG